jgi:hypothetical protein
VTTTVHFYNQPQIRTVEVDNVAIDRSLPIEAPASDLFMSQLLPEPSFGGRHVCPQGAGQLLETRIVRNDAARRHPPVPLQRGYVFCGGDASMIRFPGQTVQRMALYKSPRSSVGTWPRTLRVPTRSEAPPQRG